MVKLFSDLPISAYVRERLQHSEFITPTPVQAACIPVALEGKDILATAQTGSGKTLAFLIPIVEQLLEEPANGVSSLVLVPTRELAIQVTKQYDALRGKKLPAAATVVGGLSENDQVKAVKTARLIVATPGRLEDLMSRKLVNLSKVVTLVLDEADRMLDMGFAPSVKRIVARTSRDRQTLCFSATLEASVIHVIDEYLYKPVRIELGSTLKPTETIQLRAYEVMSDQKLGLLQKLLSEEPGRSIIFARTKRGAERLAKRLAANGFSATMIHGDRTQAQRNQALAAFQKGSIKILVATDVAARGIHVDEIEHVINYDMPEMAEHFVHRVGRTGRAGASGVASTFVMAQERNELKKLERELNLKIERISVDGQVAREERPGPVDVSKLQPVQVEPGSRMVRLPGEVLQRYQRGENRQR